MLPLTRRSVLLGVQGVRHISENALRKRIQSTKNIQKITASMKMVSAAKMRGDQKRLEDGRDFGVSMNSVFIPQDRGISEEDMGDAVEELNLGREGKNKVLYVVISSDRGLCGGVNSQVTRRLRSEVEATKAAGDDFEVLVVGDKGRAQIVRRFPAETTTCVDEVWKHPLNFGSVSGLAEHICAKECNSVKVIFNYFKSVISYEPTLLEIPKFVSYANIDPDTDAQDDEPLDGLAHLQTYDFEPEGKECMMNLYEYTVASTLFGCILENLASEQSARMTAMDNASKNAGEMIERLTLIYNRARQSKITTELTEIISGAESLKKDED